MPNEYCTHFEKDGLFSPVVGRVFELFGWCFTITLFIFILLKSLSKSSELNKFLLRETRGNTVCFSLGLRTLF